MKIRPHRFLCLALGVAALTVVSGAADAQSYPSRPITMIVPYSAGGPTDVAGRVVAERMSISLRQPIIIENVGGADGSIGLGRAARARPDGYTIDFGDMNTHVLNGTLYSPPYDVLKAFAAISPVGTFPRVLLARKSIPAKDLNELVAWLRMNSNEITVASTSVGYRLIMTNFQEEIGAVFVHVPYRGAAPAMQDLVPGQIDMAVGTTTELPLVYAGSIKAYAVTSDARLSSAPEVPTFAEMGLPAVAMSGWFAIFAPKDTLNAIITALNEAVREALADSVVRSRFIELGLEIVPRERQTPEALDD